VTTPGLVPIGISLKENLSNVLDNQAVCSDTDPTQAIISTDLINN